MAAGNDAASSQGGRGSALDSALDRRFQGVTNTMESIQGLSTWCIENKKHNSAVVRSWIKWLRKSEASHRLNLFYLANDVIQNCKRKNAIVYRTSFADVLPEAIKLINSVKDSKVRKSVERILNIWDERSVYPDEFILELRNGLMKKEKEVKAPVSSKAALKSKIVAEFVPQAFIEQLAKYRNSMDEIDLREKQLNSMRVDVCSTEALKKLKDKAGGKRFCKDFDEGSAKLQDFVAFLDGQVKRGPVLLEALENADIFYEMQYKEVKIVTSAYQTFANRVSHLKRKLDALKAMLPSMDDSPIPSPSMDAPSPTGSESPFHGLAHVGVPDPELDGQALDDDDDDYDEPLITLGDAPSPLSSVGGSPKPSRDNRDVEDMELSDTEENESVGIIVEEAPSGQGAATSTASASLLSKPLLANEAAAVKQAPPPPETTAPVNPSTPVNLPSVDLGKISSILSSLTSAMKSSGASSGCRPSPGTPTTPSTPVSSLKSPGPASQSCSPLANILSRVDASSLLSVLSKTQSHGGGLQGISSLLNNQAGKASVNPPASNKEHSQPSSVSLPDINSSTPMENSSTVQSTPISNPKPIPGDLQGKIEMKEPPSSLSSSLELKINSFLRGNPDLCGYDLGLPLEAGGEISKNSSNSPSFGQENLDGTPVRDESGATPTQDEVMDSSGQEQIAYQGEPSKTRPAFYAGTTNPLSLGTSLQNSQTWNNPDLQGPLYGDQNGRDYRPYSRNTEGNRLATETKVDPYQRIETLVSTVAGNKKPSVDQMITPNAVNKVAVNQTQAQNRWYDKPYLEEHKDHFDKGYPGRDLQQPRTDQPLSNFFSTPLPPIPQLPPPPQEFLPDLSDLPEDSRVPVKRSDQSESDVLVRNDDVKGDQHPAPIAKDIIHRPLGPMTHPRHLGPFSGPRAPLHRPRGPLNHPIPRAGPVDYGHTRSSPPPVTHFQGDISPPRSPYHDSLTQSPSPPSYVNARPLSTNLVHPPPPFHRPPHPIHHGPQRPIHPRPPFLHPQLNYPRDPLIRGLGKRPGPMYSGPPGPRGPFFPPKRPYMPPRY